jgi:hypothetical protein
MKVLVVTGDSGDTNNFLLGVVSSHQCKMHSLMSDQISALVGKYEDIKNVPAAEMHTILYESAKQVIGTLDSFDPDVILGIGIGANVLTYLISYREWDGSSIIIDPMPIPKGTFKLIHGEEDFNNVVPSAWIVKNSFVLNSGNHVKKISYFKNAVMTVTCADEKFGDVCSSKTILAAIDAVS